MPREVWTILKILQWTQQFFARRGIENPRLDAELLLCAVLHKKRIDLYTHFDEPLEAQELVQYRQYVARRGAREPVAYILGSKGFLQHEFKVTKDTLIPRPETESIVERLVHMNRTKGVRHILDMGCGSGAIIVSLLAALPQAQGMAVDISPAAVRVTEENGKALGVSDRLKAVASDLYANLPEGATFDVIVSNPPYIPHKDLNGLQQEVQWEPKSALDGGEDGLDFYRRILKDVWTYLKPTGLLAFEIGVGEADAIKELCTQTGFSTVQVVKDYGDIPRMVFAVKEGSDYGNEMLENNRKG